MINIGLIGYGYWGPNYTRILGRENEVKLKWVCDLDESLLKKAKLLYPDVNVTNNYRELLKNNSLDAVIIATSTSTHAFLIFKALHKNIHVLVEKPICTKYFLAERLALIANKRKLHLVTGHTYLFHPAINYLKNIIDKNELGDILFITSQRTNLGPIRKDVDAMWDLAPHDISNLLYLTGSLPISITASGSAYINEHQADIVNMGIKMKNNVFCSILVSWLSPVKVRRMSIVGSKKMAIFDETETNSPLKIINKSLSKFKKGEIVKFYDFQKFGFSDKGTYIPTLPKTEPLKEEIEYFINILLKKEKPRIKIDHALMVVKILEAGEKSLKFGREINF